MLLGLCDLAEHAGTNLIRCWAARPDRRAAGRRRCSNEPPPPIARPFVRPCRRWPRRPAPCSPAVNGRIETAVKLVLMHDVMPQADGSILVGSSRDPLSPTSSWARPASARISPAARRPTAGASTASRRASEARAGAAASGAPARGA